MNMILLIVCTFSQVQEAVSGVQPLSNGHRQPGGQKKMAERCAAENSAIHKPGTTLTFLPENISASNPADPKRALPTGRAGEHGRKIWGRKKCPPQRSRGGYFAISKSSSRELNGSKA